MLIAAHKVPNKQTLLILMILIFWIRKMIKMPLKIYQYKQVHLSNLISLIIFKKHKIQIRNNLIIS